MSSLGGHGGFGFGCGDCGFGFGCLGCLGG